MGLPIHVPGDDLEQHHVDDRDDQHGRVDEHADDHGADHNTDDHADRDDNPEPAAGVNNDDHRGRTGGDHDRPADHDRRWPDDDGAADDHGCNDERRSVHDRTGGPH
jgi:hypothetical protein